MKFISKALFLIVLVTGYFSGNAQTPETKFKSTDIIPPTPNAMKMTEYQSQRPNMYTGTANVSIPLYTIDFDGWKLPLSISYNATGIRTNEEASEVGLGWALSATGVISRTVKDSDDLLKGIATERRGYVYNEVAINYNFGFDWQAQEIPPPGSYYAKLAQSHPDTQPDIFNYNFFGYSGSFVLSQKVATSNIIIVRKTTQDASLITYDETLGTFTVTTPDGFKGEFTVREKSTSFASSVLADNRMDCCSQGYIDIQQVKNNGKYRATSTWYLSKITSPRGQIINFNYDLNPDGSSPYLSNSRAFAELQDITTHETCLQTVQEHVYLKSIVSEEVRVDFSMEFREDLKRNTLFTGGGYFPASLPLLRFSGLTITGIDPSSTLNKHITFVQRYFNQQYQNSYQELENEVRWMRSRLDRVIIDDQEHRFYYDNGDKGLPDKLTNGIDHFGFYNGEDNTVQLLPPDPDSLNYPAFLGSPVLMSDTIKPTYYKQKFNRRVIFSSGKAGLLVKVKYPTRGYTLFEYEPHAYFPDQTIPFRERGTSYGNLAGGARIKSIKEFDYNDNLLLSKTYKYKESPTASPSPTTGRLMTPLYNRYSKRLFNHNHPPPYEIHDVNYLYKTNSTLPGNNSSEDKNIGYSKVHEIVVGSGAESYTNTYYFENRPNKLLTWNTITVNYKNLNGQVTEIRNYDSQGKIVQQIKNQDYHHRLDSIKAIVYEFPNDGLGSSPYIDWAVRYSVPITFNTPYTIVTTTSETPSGIVEATDGSISSYGKANQTQQTLAYNTTGLAPTYLLRSQQVTNSKNEILKTEYKRPSDYAAPYSSITYMKTKNILAPVIEEITTRNGVVISARASRYERELPSGPRVNLISTFSYNKSLGSFASPTDGYSFTAIYEKTADFDYDAFSGKMKEFKGADGITNSFIWGYNYKLPIVHGIGITYDQLNTAYSASVGNPNYETLIRNHSSTAAGQVSTYSYMPLVGIASVINPSLYKKTYQYDAYSRLNKVLDNDGNTLEQYQYHFKEVPPTRILSVSGLTANGDLNFGVLTPDMYTIPFIPVERCTDKLLTKILKVSNTGEVDLDIYSVSLPSSAFSLNWTSGTISPGTSVDITVTFNCAPNGTVPFANYTGNITFSSNRTNTETISIPVNATFAQRTCGVTTNPTPVMDFGMTGSSVFGRNFDVINNGNAPIGIYGITLALNGNPTPDFGISSPSIPPLLSSPYCIDPGVANAKIFQANFFYHGSLPTMSYMSLDVGGVCTASSAQNIIKLQANVPVTRIINVATSPSTTLPIFTTPSVTQNITVSNPGNAPLSVTGFTTSPNNAMFSLSPNSFTVPAGGQQIVVLTFAPTAYNFAVQSTTISFTSNKTSGVNSITMTGQRTSTKVLQLSTNSFAFDGPSFTPQYITITNSSSSNDYLYINGVTNPNTTQWNATINNIPVTLTPGQSTTMAIMKKVAEPSTVNLTVLSNKSSGNEVVQVVANTRTLGYANTSFPAFSSASYTQNMTVSNSGNTTLNVTNITSSNSKFTLSPASFSVAPGGQQTVGITYTPIDFTSQSTSLVLYSNATNYSGTTTINTSAQRTQVYQMSVSTSSVVINPELSLESKT